MAEKTVADVTTEVSSAGAKAPASKTEATTSAPTKTADAAKEPTLEQLREQAKKAAPKVKVERVDPKPPVEKDGVLVAGDVGHVTATFADHRIAHAVHEGCSADEAEAIVLRSVIAHHGG